MSLDDGSWKKTGPDDFNGYGYFYLRLYWTGFGLPANIVEEYILLSVLLHVFVGLKRTWDMKLALVQTQGINVLNLAISGLMLLTFMTIHLFQFRFGDTDQFGPYYIRPPPYLINFWGHLLPEPLLDLRRQRGEGRRARHLRPGLTALRSLPPRALQQTRKVETVGSLRLWSSRSFKNPLWSFFYIFSVFIFMLPCLHRLEEGARSSKALSLEDPILLTAERPFEK